eukprot:RCo055645
MRVPVRPVDRCPPMVRRKAACAFKHLQVASMCPSLSLSMRAVNMNQSPVPTPPFPSWQLRFPPLSCLTFPPPNPSTRAPRKWMGGTFFVVGCLGCFALMSPTSDFHKAQVCRMPCVTF